MLDQSIKLVPISRVGCLHEIEGPESERLRTALAFHTQQTHALTFPGPNPVSIDRGHFPAFRTQPYFLAEKTDGVRFIMMACMYQGIRLCAIFDRTLTPYVFCMKKMPKALTQGTVFDGELVFDETTKTLTFLVFDAITVCGVPVFKSPFRERLEIARASLKFYEYTPDKDTASVEIKRFYESKHEFLDSVDRSARFRHDGVVLMPAYDPVVFGRHDALFKLKTHHTVDFVARGGRLYVYNENAKRIVHVGTASGPRAMLANDDAIVECEPEGHLDDKGRVHRWRVLGVRTDKATCNTKFVYDKTLLNIRESLTLDQLPIL